MAWFGDSFSNITGQISNFTKEVLTEGTEEIDDHVTELRVARNKIKQLENQCSVQSTEIDQLRHANRELQENVESAELQINAISSEYRELVARKEAELKDLKHSHHELEQRLLSSVIRPGVPSSPTLSHSTSTSQLTSPVVNRSGFHSDEADLSDVIASQHEINRLNQEVQRLHAETQHWRQLVSSQTNLASSVTGETDVTVLKTEIKDLKLRLNQEVDDSQKELAALQDVHAQKISALKRAHKQQIGEVNERITELEQQLVSAQTSDGEGHGSVRLAGPHDNGKDEIEKLQQELREKSKELTILGRQLEALQAAKLKLSDEVERYSTAETGFRAQVESLQASVSSVTTARDEALETVKQQSAEIESLRQSQGSEDGQLHRQLSDAQKRIEELQLREAKVRSDLFTTKTHLLKQLETNHAQTTEMLRDLQSARRSFGRDIHARKAEIIQEKHQLVSRIIEAGQQTNELRTSVSSLEAEEKSISREATDIVTDIGNDEHQQITADIVDSLEEENKVLQQHSQELQDTVDHLQRVVMELSAEKVHWQHSMAEMSGEVEHLRALKRSDSEKTLELIGDSETESNLGHPLDRHVSSTPLHSKPTAHNNSSENSGGNRLLPFDAQGFDELETDSVVSGFSEISARNRLLDDQVHSLQQQIEHYETEIEQFELVRSDWQMEKEALEDVLVKLRQELRDKEMQMTVAQAQQGSKATKRAHLPTVDGSKGLIAVEKHDRTSADSESESESDIETGIHDLVQKVELLTLANAQLERERDQLMKSKNGIEEELSSVKTQYEDLHASFVSKDERKSQGEDDVVSKLEEKEQQLAEISVERDALLTSLDELDSQHQTAMTQIVDRRDQLTKENKEMTQQLCDIRQQLETSVEEMRNLSSEREHLQQEISQLRTKLEAGAMAVNDLHMDKKELESTISELKGRIEAGRNSELKYKKEKSELEQNLAELSEKLESAKGELFLLRENSANTDKMNKLQDKVDYLEKQVEAENEARVRHQKDNEELQQNVAELEGVVANMSEERQRLSVKVESSEKQYSAEVEQLNVKYEKYVEELETQVDALKAEKAAMEKEMNQAEHKYTEQCRKLENYVQELTSAREMDSSSLQQEHEKVMKLVHGKEMEISKLEAELEETRSELEDNKELLQSTIDGQQPLTDLISEREQELATVRREHREVVEENVRLSQNLEHAESDLKRYKDIENLFQSVREENKKLFGELEALKAKQDSENIDTRTLDVITELESEINSLNYTISDKDREITDLQKVVEEHKCGIALLNEKKHEHLLKLSLSEENLERYGIQLTLLEQQLKSVEQERNQLKCKLEGYDEQGSEEIRKKLERLSSAEAGVVTTEGAAVAGMIEWKGEPTIVQSSTESVDGHGHLGEEQKVAHLELSLVEREQEVSVLKKDIDEVKVKCDREVSKLNKHCDILKEEITARDQEIEQLSDRLDSSQLNLEAKCNELNECMQALEALQRGSSSMRLDAVDSDSLLSGSSEVKRTEHLERESVSDEIKEMRKIIRDKDEVINELRENSNSLFKMLDDKSLSVYGDSTLTELHRLQATEAKHKMEKEQIMAVLNEKSRENSSLKNEVHRLMNAVSQEKVALTKLQNDKTELIHRKSDDQDHDMTKEAVHNLSRIIRDKDLEIDSLQQKNQTLLAVLQESSPQSGSQGQSVDSEQITGLLQEKEALVKQLAAYQSEREQMIALVNQKHQEAVAYHGEVQRLTAFIQEEGHAKETLEQQYKQLSQTFEANKQCLVDVQNELLVSKQKCSDNEKMLSDMSAREEEANVPKSLFDAQSQQIEELKDKLVKQKQALLEKDNIVGDLLQQNNQKDRDIHSKESENSSLRKQVDSLTFQMEGLESNVHDLTSENQSLLKKCSDHDAEAAILKEINSKLTLSVRDREYEVNSLKDKVNSLASMAQARERGESSEVGRLLQESESLQSQSRMFQQERDQVLLALQQRQLENSQLVEQVSLLKSQEQKLSKELERLRAHLLQIEEGYTREALEAEEREKDLRTRLAVAEEKAQSSSSAVESVNLQASQQMDNLQQQLHQVASQRDQAVLQLQSSQEQTRQYAHSLANLQMVLEQFQTEKAVEQEQHLKELENQKQECMSLKVEVAQLKNEVVEQSDALEAALRLSEQLDRKDEAMNALKHEVELRENQLKEAEDRIHQLSTSTEGKVDKAVIKNLFMGYFTAPQAKRQEVLRLVGSVLDFTHDQLVQIGAESSGRGWLPSLWGSKPTPPVTPSKGQVNQSFSELFVNFLERESSPKPQLKLPVEAMVKEEQQKQHQRPAFNPFSAPKHASQPVRLGELQGQSDSQLLMSAIPTFTPVLSATEPAQNSATSSRSSTPSGGAILKNVLNQSS